MWERLPVNDPRQCGCEVRHVALRHLLYAEGPETGLAERVTQIKTKFWIAQEEQNDLFTEAAGRSAPAVGLRH